MNRLTERFSDDNIPVVGCCISCKHDYEYCDPYQGNCPTINEIYKKLALYEDLEEQGKLYILYNANVYPCTNCGSGWATVSTKSCKSCHDDCEKLKEYYKKKYGY